MAAGLQSILSPILPAERLAYTGKNKPRTYCTFQKVTAQAAVNADDETKIEAITYRVTVFSKDDYTELIQTIKKALRAAGYIIYSEDGESYEPDTGYYMQPLTIQIAKE